MASINIYISGNRLFSNNRAAIDLCSKSFFGEFRNGLVIYSLFEAAYLIENKKAKIEDLNVLKKLERKDKNFADKYIVFKDLKNAGMIVKEGLKFGADFRVYEKGQAPGKQHAPYLVYVVESNKLDIKQLAARVRVAHSTAKSLLLAVVDAEGDVNYYEINWKSIK